MKRDVAQILRENGIQPSAQRLAVADYVLTTVEHPSAELVMERVHAKVRCSRGRRSTTRSTSGGEGAAQQLVLAEGRVVFDPCMEPHHHFIDESTGRIEDIAWGALKVSGVQGLEGYDVRDTMVVMRGRKGSAVPASPGNRLGRSRAERHPLTPRDTQPQHPLEKNHARSWKQAPRFQAQGRSRWRRARSSRTSPRRDFAGKWLVLYSYPKDFTFVCPTEIVEFDRRKDFEDRGAEVLGGSTDTSTCTWRGARTMRT